MEVIMIHRSFPYEPSPEDRLTRAKWARGIGILYGSALLLLVAFIVAHRFVAEPKGSAGAASASATPTASIPPITDHAPGKAGLKIGRN
jgi:hypothetical protein